MLISDQNGNIEAKRFVVGSLDTNCFVVYELEEKKGILIDPGAFLPEIKDFIDKEKIEILYTVNTHGHTDHIGANAKFAFPVLIHELDEKCLTDSMANLSYLNGVEIPPVSAVRLLHDKDKIKLNNIEFEVIHTPGHSPGSISIKYNDLIFSGDTLFFEGVGRTDLPGGDYGQIVSSIREKLFRYPDHYKVFPGHGEDTTIGYEKEHNPFI